MGLEQVFRDAAAFGLSASAIAAGLAVAVAGLYAVLRTNSLHILRTRVWHLVMGHRKCEHEQIARAIRNRDDLIQFRHFLGIQARTVGRAAAISEWAREHDEDPADIYDCDNLFDREHPGLREEKIPGPLALTGRFAVWLVIWSAFVVPWLLLTMHLDQAIVTIKLSGEWVWLSETSVRPFWGDQILTHDNCSYGVLKELPSWPQPEVRKSLCDSFTAPGLKDAIRRYRVDTWVLVVSLTIALWPLAYGFLRWARSGGVASRMLKRYRQCTSVPNADTAESRSESPSDVRALVESPLASADQEFPYEECEVHGEITGKLAP